MSNWIQIIEEYCDTGLVYNLREWKSFYHKNDRDIEQGYNICDEETIITAFVWDDKKGYEGILICKDHE